MTTTRYKAGVYARQSHGKETSVEDQVRIGYERCAALGAEVVRVSRDRVSASRFGTKARDEWPELVADVAAGRLDLLWLWDATRGDRTPESWFAFLTSCRERGVLIHAERDRHTYDVRIPRDWKTLADSGVDAAYDSEIKSKDVRRGIGEAAAQGKPAGGRPPYGYDRVYDQHDARKYTLRPNAGAASVGEIVKRIALRDPVKVVVDDLNGRGLPSPSGGQWTRQSVRKIVRNEAYVGLRKHAGELHQGNWPGIVDRKLWEDARAVLAERDRKTAAPGALKWLLSYLMTGPCGAVNTQQGQGRRAALYKCLHDSCTSIGMWEADEFVTRVILARLARKDARALFTANDAEMTAALGDVAGAEAEARELEAEARAGGLRPALVAQMDAGIQERLQAAQERVKAASGNRVALALLGDGKFTEKTARPRWDALSVAARRTVITTLVERIAVHPTSTRLTRWSTEDDRLALASERIEIEWRRGSGRV